MKQVGATVVSFKEMLLEGVAAPELMQHGLTLEEERTASGASQVAPQITVHYAAPQAADALEVLAYLVELAVTIIT